MDPTIRRILTIMAEFGCYFSDQLGHLLTIEQLNRGVGCPESRECPSCAAARLLKAEGIDPDAPRCCACGCTERHPCDPPCRLIEGAYTYTCTACEKWAKEA